MPPETVPALSSQTDGRDRTDKVEQIAQAQPSAEDHLRQCCCCWCGDQSDDRPDIRRCTLHWTGDDTLHDMNCRGNQINPSVGTGSIIKPASLAG